MKLRNMGVFTGKEKTDYLKEMVDLLVRAHSREGMEQAERIVRARQGLDDAPPKTFQY